MFAICKFLAAAVFIVTGSVAVFAPPPEGCRLKVINTGTDGYPDYGTTTCEGECPAPQSNPCKVKVYAGSFFSFECLCDGKEILPGDSVQGCTGYLTNSDGTWRISCFKIKCVATCLKANLPGAGQSVWACTCPDA